MTCGEGDVRDPRPLVLRKRSLQVNWVYVFCCCCCCCRVLRGVLAARAGRWLRDAALSDTGGGSTFNRMVTVMDQIMEAAAAL
jgi:hypothetical protein